jgi:hypothetical protein
MATGNLLVSEANVTLGNISNLHISGGNVGYLLNTNGNGTLSWVDAASTQSPSPMPIVIDVGNTLTISSNYQGLFGTTIIVDGELVIDGILIDVSGQGAPGSNAQISFNDQGSPSGNNGFTFDKISGNLNTPGSINAGSFIKLATYSKASLNGITGVIGQIAVLNDSSPNGMMAYWDGTNNRWSYVHDNSAVV